MSKIIYTASVYSREVSYKNFKGEEKTVELFFALDPLELMTVISQFELPKPNKKSGNPAARNETPEITEEQQLKFVRTLAVRAAGFPSDDGESWEPFEDFNDSIAGKAFLTKLASSDGDRLEFAEKVLLDPFRAFVGYARADEGNDASEIEAFDNMLVEMENIFKAPKKSEETLEQRKARLQAEMDSLKDTE